MKNTFYILGFLIAGLTGEKGFAQKSAGAVMNISVEVVRGLQSISETNDIVFHHNTILEEDENRIYGTLELQVARDTDYIISSFDKIKLINKKGETLNLDSISKKRLMGNNRVIIEMSGKLHSDHMKHGVYLGSQVARIDFF